MDNIKIAMTIVLPGRTMLSRKEARKNLKENYEHTNMEIVSFDKGKKVKETLHIHTRKCINATQAINMSQEAYDYMTSEECPEWFANKQHTAKDWRKMSKVARLNTHLQRTCEGLGGISYTYEVFPD